MMDDALDKFKEHLRNLPYLGSEESIRRAAHSFVLLFLTTEAVKRGYDPANVGFEILVKNPNAFSIRPTNEETTRLVSEVFGSAHFSLN
ncbi:hypothetical protein [Mesotoga sp. UBA6090]|uniref:hypothetical protein n=1 Tax=Mesotoga sp. UBA6090 TaxID=1946860 RepID=UPI0025E4A31D|nr:hypothetical protein [Mesotoga sp. UBA6090]